MKRYDAIALFIAMICVIFLMFDWVSDAAEEARIEHEEARRIELTNQLIDYHAKGSLAKP